MNHCFILNTLILFEFVSASNAFKSYGDLSKGMHEGRKMLMICNYRQPHKKIFVSSMKLK